MLSRGYHPPVGIHCASAERLVRPLNRSTVNHYILTEALKYGKTFSLTTFRFSSGCPRVRLSTMWVAPILNLSSMNRITSSALPIAQAFFTREVGTYSL